MRWENELGSEILVRLLSSKNINIKHLTVRFNSRLHNYTDPKLVVKSTLQRGVLFRTISVYKLNRMTIPKIAVASNFKLMALPAPLKLSLVKAGFVNASPSSHKHSLHDQKILVPCAWATMKLIARLA